MLSLSSKERHTYRLHECANVVWFDLDPQDPVKNRV